MDQELEKYRKWVGRTQIQEDIAAPFPPKALIATLDARDPAPAKGDPLPPLWHWLYFLEAAPASNRRSISRVSDRAIVSMNAAGSMRFTSAGPFFCAE